MTVPGQTFSLSTIIAKVKAGQPISLRSPAMHYDENPDFDSIDFNLLDSRNYTLEEIDALLEANKSYESNYAIHIAKETTTPSDGIAEPLNEGEAMK